MSGTGWAWSFFPRRLRTDEAFLDLPREDRALLRELYDAADKWGRGPGDRLGLMQALATVDGYDAAPGLDRLERAGFVRTWSASHPDSGQTVSGRQRRIWELVGWDADAPADLIRKRKGRSDYPDPTPGNRGAMPAEPYARTAPSGQTLGGQRADDVQTAPAPQAPSGQTLGAECPAETRRDETRRDKPPAGAAPARPPAPTRAYEPPAPALEWPSPGHEQAAQQYLRLLAEHTGRPPPYKLSALHDLATTYRHGFVLAVRELSTKSQAWQGWHVKQPRNWLETACRSAEEDETKARAKPAPPAPPPSKPDGPAEPPRFRLPRADGSELVFCAELDAIARLADSGAAVEGDHARHWTLVHIPRGLDRGQRKPWNYAEPEHRAEILLRYREAVPAPRPA